MGPPRHPAAGAVVLFALLWLALPAAGATPEDRGRSDDVPAEERRPDEIGPGADEGPGNASEGGPGEVPPAADPAPWPEPEPEPEAEPAPVEEPPAEPAPEGPEPAPDEPPDGNATSSAPNETSPASNGTATPASNETAAPASNETAPAANESAAEPASAAANGTTPGDDAPAAEPAPENRTQADPEEPRGNETVEPAPPGNGGCGCFPTAETAPPAKRDEPPVEDAPATDAPPPTAGDAPRPLPARLARLAEDDGLTVAERVEQGWVPEAVAVNPLLAPAPAPAAGLLAAWALAAACLRRR